MVGTDRSVFSVEPRGEKEIVLRRVFDAPRRLVFEAWTKPEHVRRWWGCRDYSMTVCEIDFRIGGAWKYVVRMGDKDIVFKGVYREIVPPERLVFSECYDEPAYGCPTWLTTTTFEEADGRTTLTSVLVHETAFNRDGHLGSGMERGSAETMERLAAYVAELEGQG